jgi:hypothetical protein
MLDFQFIKMGQIIKKFTLNFKYKKPINWKIKFYAINYKISNIGKIFRFISD